MIKRDFASGSLPSLMTSGPFAFGFEKQHSGGTVRDFHPLPYSPRIRGTQSLHKQFKERPSE
jgi:hypothetical protein